MKARKKKAEQCYYRGVMARFDRIWNSAVQVAELMQHIKVAGIRNFLSEFAHEEPDYLEP